MKIGMTHKDIVTLSNMLNRPAAEPAETLAEHIAAHKLQTEERTSKRGMKLTTVHFENGLVREYETSRLSATTFFGC